MDSLARDFNHRGQRPVLHNIKNTELVFAIEIRPRIAEMMFILFVIYF